MMQKRENGLTGIDMVPRQVKAQDVRKNGVPWVFRKVNNHKFECALRKTHTYMSFFPPFFPPFFPLSFPLKYLFFKTKKKPSHIPSLSNSFRIKHMHIYSQGRTQVTLSVYCKIALYVFVILSSTLARPLALWTQPLPCDSSDNTTRK